MKAYNFLNPWKLAIEHLNVFFNVKLAQTWNVYNFENVDEVKLAVAPCGSSEKNCWGWEGVSLKMLF